MKAIVRTSAGHTVGWPVLAALLASAGCGSESEALNSAAAAGDENAETSNGSEPRSATGWEDTEAAEDTARELYREDAGSTTPPPFEPAALESPNDGGAGALLADGPSPSLDAAFPDAPALDAAPDALPPAPPSCPPPSCDPVCHDDPALVTLAPLTDAGPAPSSRFLGEGRHPVAADCSGFAVAFVEPGGNDPPRIGLSPFTAQGARRAESPWYVHAGTLPLLISHPVVAPLPGGRLAVAYTDLDPGFLGAEDPPLIGDGDALGIALRWIDPETGDLGPILHANDAEFPPDSGLPWLPTEFSQLDPDILTVGSTVVVAWVDSVDPVTGPDVRYRLFDDSLEGDPHVHTLADGAAAESHVALAPFADSWAAAWRSTFEGTEQIEIAAGGERWSVGPFLPPPPSDRPALAELDDERLLLVFTEGTDPEESGVANNPRLRAAVLDRLAPGTTSFFSIDPLDPDYAADFSIAQSHPAAVRVGGRIYIAWRSSRIVGDPRGEELWVKEIFWEPDEGGDGLVIDLGEPELPLPRRDEHRFGDQRFPALAPTPLLPEGALVAVWDDYGRVFGGEQGTPDVIVQLMPAPVSPLSGGPLQ